MKTYECPRCHKRHLKKSLNKEYTYYCPICNEDFYAFEVEMPINKKSYKENKEAVREQAIEWQMEFSQNDHYMSECAYWNDYFAKLGKRYGLLKEFRENGII